MKEKNKFKTSFEISNTSASLVNELRRIMIEEVPVMAIEEVEFKENSSVLYDEILAHRLGLIPLTTDLKSYNLPEECKCKGKLCPRCSVKLSLRAKGPCMVYASDLKSKDPKIKPVFPKMPIVELLKNQELEFVATAILGKGKDHMKFSPCLAYYSYKPIIKVNNNQKLLTEFKDKYPPQIFNEKGEIKKELINTPQLIDAVEGVCDDLVKVEYKEDEFVFYIESWGQLSCKEIMKTAVKILKQKLDEFVSFIK